MDQTYTRGRGLHWWECHRCAGRWPVRIPDQADADFIPNRGAPTLAVCPNCNHRHFPTIRLVTRTPRPWTPNDSVDGDGDPRGDGHLDGQWGEWARIAARFSRRAAYQDRDDLRHAIIIRLATVQERRGEELTEGGMIRTASYVVMEYWHEQQRNGQFLSLDATVDDGEDEADFRDTLADDRAIDLAAWVDARTWLLGCPKRLVEIAHNRVAGIPVGHKDREYLRRFRRKLVQLRLI